MKIIEHKILKLQNNSHWRVGSWNTDYRWIQRDIINKCNVWFQLDPFAIKDILGQPVKLEWGLKLDDINVL